MIERTDAREHVTIADLTHTELTIVDPAPHFDVSAPDFGLGGMALGALTAARLAIAELAR